MPDEPLDWLRHDVGDSADRPPPRKRWALLALGIGLWLTVATAMLARPALPDPDAAASAAPSAGSPSVTPSPLDEAGPAPSATSTQAAPAADNEPAVTIVAPGTSSAPGPGQAATVAVAVVRAWLGGSGPRLAIRGVTTVGDGYVEHLVIEAVDRPGPHAAVVTVVALVLPPDGSGYGDARVERLAVPVRLDEGRARPAGAPWRLDPPDLTVAAPDLTPLDDPLVATEAGSALAAAGYEDIEVQAVRGASGWPLVVTARAVAPGTRRAAIHEVWLRQHLDRLVVAGTTADDTAAVSR